MNRPLSIQQVFLQWLLRCAIALSGLMFSGQALALASCDATTENVVTFVFGTARSTNASGGTGTWTAAALGPFSFPVGTTTAGGITANTITFQASIDATVAWAAPGGTAPNSPRLATYGNIANNLTLTMDAPTTSIGTHLSLTFNRPMDKVEFVMTDVDYSGGAWQDILRITGYLNGNAVVAPTFTPQLAGQQTITLNTPTPGTTEAIARAAGGNCATNSANCNITVSFANPIDSLRIDFVGGPDVANPASQVVGFQNFSYCVPKRDLYLVKTDSPATFNAGGTGTYLLTITNQGGTQTLVTPAASRMQVQDILPQGLTFINPQAPGGGWTCALSTTSATNDTVLCDRSTALANGASTVLTLTVSISPAITATSVDNRAKVFGGGDPNKATVTSTNAAGVNGCTATSEGWDGGGSAYASGAATNAGCGFETTAIFKPSALLSITKTNGVTSKVAGSTGNYVITVVNSGPDPAPGTIVQDPAVPGLNCTAINFSTNPAGGAVTPTLTVNAFQSTGVAITPTFPANSTATFTLTCGVTATGQ